MAPIYMDNHATTPVDPRVLEAMLPYLRGKFGNAASAHAFGREAAEAAARARGEVAELVGADASEIVFTSGATESDNLAIQGVAGFLAPKVPHVVTAATEPPAVLGPCRALQRQGRARVTVLPVRRDGLIDLDGLRAAMTRRTALVSIMFANNETGVLQPVAEIGRICRERGVLFHTDAAQACGKVPVDVESMRIDLLSLTAHKMYGPKGVGALYVRKRDPRVRLAPLLHGGGQERGLRPGTLPVPLLAGLGEACRLARKEGPAESKRILALRERLRRLVFENIDRVHLHGSLERRLPGNLNVGFEFVDGGRLLRDLGDIAVSPAAACTVAHLEPSHVLAAMGVREDVAFASIRFGLGRFNTRGQVEAVARRLRAAVARQRAHSPLYREAAGITG